MVLGKAKFCICILLAATVLRLQNHKCESPVSNTVFKIQSFYSDSELYLCRSFFREQVHGTITYTQFRIPLLLAALLYFWCKLHFLYRHQICRHGKNQFQLFYAYVLQNSKVWYIQDRKNQPEIWFLSCAKASKKMCQCHLRNHFSPSLLNPKIFCNKPQLTLTQSTIALWLCDVLQKKAKWGDRGKVVMETVIADGLTRLIVVAPESDWL